MNKKATIKTVNNTDVLFINDKPAQCPYKQAIPIQDKFGSLQLINTECNSQCPFFDLNENFVTLLCSKLPVSIDIERENSRLISE
jgi:hypothetical protein